MVGIAAGAGEAFGRPGIVFGKGPSDECGSQRRADQSFGARTGAVAVLSLAVAVVLGDSGVVTLALPEILRDFGAQVGGVAWVLIAFNLVLALLAVPAARLCVRRDPAVATAGGVIAVRGRNHRMRGGTVVGCADRGAGGPGGRGCGGDRGKPRTAGLRHRNRARGSRAVGRSGCRRGGTRPGGRGAPDVGVLVAGDLRGADPRGPAPAARRDRAARTGAAASDNLETSPDRPHVLANLALALLSAALTAALFLLVLLLVDGWDRSPAVAAVAVTAVPVAALLAGPRVPRRACRDAVRGGRRVGADRRRPTGLALLPGAKLVWTLAPQVLIGLGLGLSVDSLTVAALRDRNPRALHGGWTIAARHAGVVAGLAILTPIFTADLRHAETPAKEAIASLVLDAPLPASTKLDLAGQLGSRLVAERGRVPDLRPAFKAVRVPAAQAPAAAALERGLEDQLKRAATSAFRTAFLVAAGLALLALGPALALSDRSRT